MKVELNDKLKVIVKNLYNCMVFQKNIKKTENNPCSYSLNNLKISEIGEYYINLMKALCIHSKCKIGYCNTSNKSS